MSQLQRVVRSSANFRAPSVCYVRTSNFRALSVVLGSNRPAHVTASSTEGAWERGSMGVWEHGGMVRVWEYGSMSVWAYGRAYEREGRYKIALKSFARHSTCPCPPSPPHHPPQTLTLNAPNNRFIGRRAVQHPARGGARPRVRRHRQPRPGAHQGRGTPRGRWEFGRMSDVVLVCGGV